MIGFTGDVMDEANNLFTNGGAVAVMCKPYHMATIVRTFQALCFFSVGVMWDGWL